MCDPGECWSCQQNGNPTSWKEGRAVLSFESGRSRQWLNFSVFLRSTKPSNKEEETETGNEQLLIMIIMLIRIIV